MNRRNFLKGLAAVAVVALLPYHWFKGTIVHLYPRKFGNDGPRIQAAMDEVADTGGIVFFHSGTYYMGNKLNVSKGHVNLVGIGKTTKIMRIF